jgi:hypothetical protein
MNLSDEFAEINHYISRCTNLCLVYDQY